VELVFEQAVFSFSGLLRTESDEVPRQLEKPNETKGMDEKSGERIEKTINKIIKK